jgi:hypothetical protein
VEFYLRVGRVELPGRGKHCLAAERGECVQKDGDKGNSWGCASGSARPRLGLRREGGS